VCWQRQHAIEELASPIVNRGALFDSPFPLAIAGEGEGRLKINPRQVEENVVERRRAAVSEPLLSFRPQY
jgi:hypothetical protein